ncbi:MAG: DNA mismatch endonuclease Vsr [Anaerolineae bacterium]|nr:MAG: DNA mismatch endonuclease Vsr [Anaerolineae bacterium]
MPDVLTPEQRKLNMSRIKSKNTRPEILVRSMIHSMGYRYSLHSRRLPGKPDLVLTRHKKIILVNGCFWHMHKCRYGKVKPITRADFWEQKRLGNVQRDRANLAELKKLGWHVLVVWECWTKDPVKLRTRLAKFLQLNQ